MAPAKLVSRLHEISDDPGEVLDYFTERRWGDGLPVIPPTPERVAAMIDGARRDPAEVIGRLGPIETDVTVEKVAVNAVMAGAKPEYFPVILALAATQVSARASTTSSAAAMAVVNGPIREEIRMNQNSRDLGHATTRRNPVCRRSATLNSGAPLSQSR